eukprot:Tbor_TRINITY_DN6122_c3_g1::TRINITY_DN6122_c3_g1_i2::g.22754::m.22754
MHGDQGASVELSNRYILPHKTHSFPRTPAAAYHADEQCNDIITQLSSSCPVSQYPQNYNNRMNDPLIHHSSPDLPQGLNNNYINTNVRYADGNNTPIIKAQRSDLKTPKWSKAASTPILQVVAASDTPTPSPGDSFDGSPMESSKVKGMRKSSNRGSSNHLIASSSSILMKEFLAQQQQQQKQHDEVLPPQDIKSFNSLPSVISNDDDHIKSSWEGDPFASPDEKMPNNNNNNTVTEEFPLVVTEVGIGVKVNSPTLTSRSGKYKNISSVQEINKVDYKVEKRASRLRYSIQRPLSYTNIVSIQSPSETDSPPLVTPLASQVREIADKSSENNENENDHNSNKAKINELSELVQQLEMALRTEKCMGEDMRDRVEDLETAVEGFKGALQSAMEEAAVVEKSYIEQREDAEKRHKSEIEQVRAEMIATIQQNNECYINHLTKSDLQNHKLNEELKEKVMELSNERVQTNELRNELFLLKKEHDNIVSEQYYTDKLTYQALYAESQAKTNKLFRENEVLTESVRLLEAQQQQHCSADGQSYKEVKSVISVIPAEQCQCNTNSNSYYDVVTELANLKVVLAEYKSVLDRLGLQAPFPDTFSRSVVIRGELLLDGEGTVVS